MENEIEKERLENQKLNIDLNCKKSEISSLLAVSGLAFLCLDNHGKVCQPISIHCGKIFKNEIEGKKLSDVLFLT